MVRIAVCTIFGKQIRAQLDSHHNERCIEAKLRSLTIAIEIELSSMEAWERIELSNTGFADPCLTTWLPRHVFRERRGTPLALFVG